ncbi:RNA polymerase sigma factor [Billgrantia kenyensis]|uniref:Uncharacterized protein n=1 Tax=Billgrantia kenyensis TaxID=321266 RepID=A0A7W0ADU4_9GAMM|nr:hypothetical protein [Halomonas kenyensis]MBA2779004.1 hypothetical protein [Halomonas kenyensis]MCG6662931.1 hypothetical protein [Halomonas kenyensis]
MGTTTTASMGVETEGLLAAWHEGDEATIQRWVQPCLPLLLGVTARLLKQQDHRELVCRDTLLLAWRNLPELENHPRPGQWLYGILGSRLYSQLLALHGSQTGVQHHVEVLTETKGTVANTPTGPRPVALAGEALAAMANRIPPEPPSQRLLGKLQALIQAEIDQRQAPFTPTGERVYPPLFDSSLRLRMWRSRAAFQLKESFKRRLGRPIEDALFERWLDDRSGSAWLEHQGLPRRSVEAYFGDKLNLEIDPASLTRGLDFPASFPDRRLRRKVSNIFLWTGDWDLATPHLAETQRQRFIRDIWAHRLDLTASEGYAQLTKALAQGAPLRSHHQGVLLNSEDRILTFLEQYRLYMEDMHCFGFKPALGKDSLGVVIDRHGDMIKSNKGLHRIAMAQAIGLRRISVRVRAVHQTWWEQHKVNARGRQAIEGMLTALPAQATRMD